MGRTRCVLALIALYVGLVKSWEIVTFTGDKFQFYETNGTLMHTELLPLWSSFVSMIYEPVHDTVLLANDQYIYSYNITSKTREPLVTVTELVTSMAYDPVTELLFWTEALIKVYSISLKPGLDNRVNEKQFIDLGPMEHEIYRLYVDICEGFIYWMTDDNRLHRARFDGSDKEVITNSWNFYDYAVDQLTQQTYWIESGPNGTNDWSYLKCGDLNGNNSREVLRLPLGAERNTLTFSKDYIYWTIYGENRINTKYSTYKIPKNASNAIEFPSESSLPLIENEDVMIFRIDAKYSIKDLTQGVQSCERLKSLLPNNTVTNASSDVSLLCVHGTKVSGESRCECTQGYSGERCDVSV